METSSFSVTGSRTREEEDGQGEDGEGESL